MPLIDHETCKSSLSNLAESISIVASLESYNSVFECVLLNVPLKKAMKSMNEMISFFTIQTPLLFLIDRPLQVSVLLKILDDKLSA